MGKIDCKVQLCEIYQAIKELWKKTADMITKTMLADPNNDIKEIYIKGKSIGLYDSKYPDNLGMPYDVGGLPAGTTAGELRWSNLTEMMDKLLFPVIEPFISTAKSAHINEVAPKEYYEVGLLLGINLNAIFDRGRITNGDNSQGPELVGPATNFQFTGTGITNPIDDQDGHYTTSVTIKLDDNMWNVKVSHTEGVGVYFDSNGNPSNILDADRVAGDVNGVSSIIKGVYAFLTGMNENDLSGGGTNIYLSLTKNIVPKNNEMEFAINGTSKYIYFAYPKSYGDLSMIKDGNGFDVTSSFDKTEEIVESVGLSDNYSLEYNIYKTKSLTSVSPSQDYQLIF